jgi:hypothetical protein
MSEFKISELGTFDILPEANDLFLATRDLDEIPETKNYSYGQMFEAVSVPANFVEPLTANAAFVSTLTIPQPYTPNSGLSPTKQGRITWDANYIYVSVSDNHIKRAALVDF